jgi:hypothetical protein
MDGREHGGTWKTMPCRLCINCYGTAVGGGGVALPPLPHSGFVTIYAKTTVHCSPEPVLFNVYGALELNPRNEFRQPVLPGGTVRKPYSSSVPSPHRLFKNSSSDSSMDGRNFNSILFFTWQIIGITIKALINDTRGSSGDLRTL